MSQVDEARAADGQDWDVASVLTVVQKAARSWNPDRLQRFPDLRCFAKHNTAQHVNAWHAHSHTFVATELGVLPVSQAQTDAVGLAPLQHKLASTPS